MGLRWCHPPPYSRRSWTGYGVCERIKCVGRARPTALAPVSVLRSTFLHPALLSWHIYASTALAVRRDFACTRKSWVCYEPSLCNGESALGGERPQMAYRSDFRPAPISAVQGINSKPRKPVVGSSAIR